jgi:hypothetical protein
MKFLYLSALVALSLAGCGKGGSQPAGNNNNNTPAVSYVVSTVAGPTLFADPNASPYTPADDSFAGTTYGITTDPAGNVFVAQKDLIRKITSGGTVTILATEPVQEQMLEGLLQTRRKIYL